jgi:hypothetical protein
MPEQLIVLARMTSSLTKFAKSSMPVTLQNMAQGIVISSYAIPHVRHRPRQRQLSGGRPTACRSASGLTAARRGALEWARDERRAQPLGGSPFLLGKEVSFLENAKVR